MKLLTRILKTYGIPAGLLAVFLVATFAVPTNQRASAAETDPSMFIEEHFEIEEDLDRCELMLVEDHVCLQDQDGVLSTWWKGLRSCRAFD